MQYEAGSAAQTHGREQLPKPMGTILFRLKYYCIELSCKAHCFINNNYNSLVLGINGVVMFIYFFVVYRYKWNCCR